MGVENTNIRPNPFPSSLSPSFYFFRRLRTKPAPTMPKPASWARLPGSGTVPPCGAPLKAPAMKLSSEG